jgi:hypothetical protein
MVDNFYCEEQPSGLALQQQQTINSFIIGVVVLFRDLKVKQTTNVAKHITVINT